MAEEEWRPIPGLEHYEASRDGRIRSVSHVSVFQGRWGTTRRHHHGKILTLKKKANGWGQTYHYFYAEGRWPQVNRSVCSAFHGPPPSDKHEAAHLDGDSTNDRASNLVWATPKENGAHKALHGTNPVGERNAAARLKATDIEPIFDRFIGGEGAAAIGADLEVCPSNIHHILRREAWAQVPISPEKCAAAQSRAEQNVKNARDRANAERSRLAGNLPRSERACAL